MADQGPFTIPVDDVEKSVGARIGVVSLPSSYRDHPLIWAALAHETGGHDVLHADVRLLPELDSAVRQVTNDQFLGQLWAYWMDEAASDVYGLLNIGPSFVVNLAAFFTTLVHQASEGRVAIGTLGNQSFVDSQNQLDVHPTDILRIHLGLGVIENLHQLSVGRRSEYIDAVQTLAEECAGNVTKIQFVALNADGRPRVLQEFPLADMQALARKVGAFIANSKLDALGGHSVQEIETWDDGDEAVAQAVANQLLSNGSVAGLGDDAQLLAGATLALLQQPRRYEDVTARLNEALDESFARDPIFRLPHAHRMFFRPELFRRVSFDRPTAPPALATFLRAEAPKRPRRRARAKA
jgi:hypothetical protein